MNKLYREAEAAYLALPANFHRSAFDPAKVSDTKIAYVVGGLESISAQTHEVVIFSGIVLKTIVSQDSRQTASVFYSNQNVRL